MLAGRRTKLAALAAAATTVLAGCGLHPGAAAVVETEAISHGKVDEVAAAVCTANVNSSRNNNQPPQTLPLRGARQVALQILLESRLSHRFGRHEGVEASQKEVSQALAQNEPALNLLPPDQREPFREALRDYAEGQLMVLEVGRESLPGQVSDEQAIQEGMRLRGEFVESLDVEVDPRYGSFEDGRYQPGASELSVPVSSFAKAGAREEPGEAFVAQLPDTLQCR